MDEDYSHHTVLLRKAFANLEAELLNEFWHLAAEHAAECRHHATELEFYAHQKMRGE